MKKFLFYFAITGWTLGLIVHLLSIAEFDISDKVPFVWVLHIGIFVVWIPMVLSLRKNEELNTYQQSGNLNRVNPFGFFKIIFKQTPTWLIVIAIGGFFYAMLNFLLFMNSAQANELRGFSGHWIAFYGIAAAALYPFNNQASLE
jgi:hypothetical protein